MYRHDNSALNSFLISLFCCVTSIICFVASISLAGCATVRTEIDIPAFDGKPPISIEITSNNFLSGTSAVSLSREDVGEYRALIERNGLSENGLDAILSTPDSLAAAADLARAIKNIPAAGAIGDGKIDVDVIREVLEIDLDGDD